jgi:hypothetical protein
MYLVYLWLATAHTRAHVRRWLLLIRNAYRFYADWMTFAAGLVPDTTTRDNIISKVQYYIKNAPDNMPWSSLYQVINGSAVTGSFNEVNVGGVFALLVREYVFSPFCELITHLPLVQYDWYTK